MNFLYLDKIATMPEGNEKYEAIHRALVEVSLFFGFSEADGAKVANELLERLSKKLFS